ncbi:MAG TPA: hypothetical protein VJL60_04660 [Gammaproteobacteria bacterium]|nr:hypothetical protein [Gammaproteobacteria bacterium]
MHKEFHYTFALLGVSILAFCLKYLITVFLANHLSPGLFGDVSIALRALGIFSSLVLLGTTASSKRFLSHYIEINDSLNAKAYILWNFRLFATTSIICLLVAIISTSVFLLLDYLKIFSIDNYHIAFYTLWITPIASLGILITNYLSCDKHAIAGYTFANVGKYTSLLVFLLFVIVFFHRGLTSFNFLFILFLALLALFFVEFLFLLKKTSLISVALAKTTATVSNETKREWLYSSYRLIVTNLIFLIVCFLDLFILEIFSAQENDVGYYSAALTIASILWVIPDGVFQFLKPKMTGYLKTPEGKIKLQKKLNRINLIVFLVATVAAVVLIVFGNIFLLHFGKAYSVAHTALTLVVLGNYIGIMQKSPTFLLIYSGQEHLILRISIVQIILLLVTGIPLAYFYNLNGMAVATAVSFCLIFFPLVYFARKKSQIRPLTIF